MEKTIQRTGLSACAVLTLVLTMAVVYFHGTRFGYEGSHIYSTAFFNFSNLATRHLGIVNDIFFVVLPIAVPWFLSFSRKDRIGNSIFLYILMMAGLLLCLWITGSILFGLETSQVNYTGSIHIELYQFNRYIDCATGFYTFVFYCLLPWLVLERTRGVKGWIWIYLLCAVMMTACIAVPGYYIDYYENQKFDYGSLRWAIILGLHVVAPIVFIYHLAVLGIDVLCRKFFRIPKIKSFHDSVRHTVVFTLKRIVADITGIGKAKYNDNNSHGKLHLLLHILLPVINIPVQKCVMAVSQFIHSANYYFFIGAEFRVLDTLVVYLIILSFAGIYLKCTGCRTITILHYAVLGILPCILTALVMDNISLADYEGNFLSY